MLTVKLQRLPTLDSTRVWVDWIILRSRLPPRLALAFRLRLAAGGKPQRINIDLEGRGTFSYSAVLAGFVPAGKLEAPTKDWRFTRHYEPAQRMFDGEPIPRGLGVLAGGYTAFKNALTQLPVGERG